MRKYLYSPPKQKGSLSKIYNPLQQNENPTHYYRKSWGVELKKEPRPKM